MCPNRNEGEASKAGGCISHDSNAVNNHPKNLEEEINKNIQTSKAEKSKGKDASQKRKIAKNLAKRKSSGGKVKSKDHSYLAITKALNEARKRKKEKKEE
ncbi:unnamed protein product [Meloidogyne enterolobii]|uniref:Uncharacterized protein n=1 Tax=Meloidogyne enterolobii TaxID=390850 RepID=A0ACB1B8L4_MELEN